MKRILLYFLFIGIPYSLIGQIDWIKALPGTWKVDQKEEFERWDFLNEKTLKGFSFRNQNGLQNVTEYLSLSKQNGIWHYKATVIEQNNGISISFEGAATGSTLAVSNPTHDFPNLILYKYLDENKLLVTISDQKGKTFSYHLERQIPTKITNSPKQEQFDPVLARSLGADAYGMKSYFLVILKTGSNASIDTEQRKESFVQHLKNIQRLVAEQKLVVAGPIAKNENNYRGIFIFQNLPTEKDVKDILESDLAIRNKFIDYNIYNWYGSAALPVYLETAVKISKEVP